MWVLVPLLILGIGWWWLARARKRTSAEVGAAVGPAAAADASSRLGAEAHRSVYRKLGRGDFMGAVQEYRAATGQGVRQCIVAVRSLEAHPQVYRAPGAGQRGTNGVAGRVAGRGAGEGAGAGPATGSERAPGSEQAPEAPRASGFGRAAGESPVSGRYRAAGEDAGGASGPEGKRAGDAAPPQSPNSQAPNSQTPDSQIPAQQIPASPTPAATPPRDPEPAPDDELVIPDDWSRQFGSAASRTTSSFRISAETDGATREFSTDELPPAEYDQFQSLIRDHDFDRAASLLARHSGLDEQSIRQLLESAPVEGPASAAAGNVSDFSFEGDGPDGRVRFSASDLPEADRRLFLAHVSAGRRREAAELVHEHTGLPVGVVLQLLSAFGDGV